ncbi:MAG: hypothetical protein U1C49_00070 [Candidatus Andersenbacteria bacterium]|nr:hypothetical protein [bacterium]MDZ4225220.1 hypothetical protein [Candidatus Andersenbacteria bacterium]
MHEGFEGVRGVAAASKPSLFNFVGGSSLKGDDGALSTTVASSFSPFDSNACADPSLMIFPG